MDRTERIAAVVLVVILFAHAFVMSAQVYGMVGGFIEAAVTTFFWASLFLMGTIAFGGGPWRTRLKRIAVLALLNYPMIIIFGFNVPGYVAGLYTPPLSAQESLQAVLGERKALGIPEETIIGLKLVNGENGGQTWWADHRGPFTIVIAKDAVSERIIRHEMYHLARVMRCGWDAQSGTGAAIVHQVRYLYIEEPLAVIYQATRIQLGFCTL